MTRLLWLAAGWAVGVAMARNAEPMTGPEQSAVVLLLLVAVVVAFAAGRRDKRSAVAVAVASARAEANARAESAASAAVHLTLQQLGAVSPAAAGPRYLHESALLWDEAQHQAGELLEVRDEEGEWYAEQEDLDETEAAPALSRRFGGRGPSGAGLPPAASRHRRT